MPRGTSITPVPATPLLPCPFPPPSPVCILSAEEPPCCPPSRHSSLKKKNLHCFASGPSLALVPTGWAALWPSQHLTLQWEPPDLLACPQLFAEAIESTLSPEMPLPHVCLHESDGSGNWKRGGAQDCGEEAVGSGGDGAASSSVMQGGGPGDGSSASQPAFGVWHARAACH